MGRSSVSVFQKARDMGLSFKVRSSNVAPGWTEKDIEQLRAMTKQGVSSEEIAKALGRSHFALRRKASDLGVQLAGRKRWTADDDRTLIFYSETKTASQLAGMLNRSSSAVRIRAMALGIKISAGRVTIKDVAEELGINHNTVSAIRDKLGINFRRYKTKGSTMRASVRGASDDQVVEIAKHILENPLSLGGRKASAKRLREVIAAYEG